MDENIYMHGLLRLFIPTRRMAIGTWCYSKVSDPTHNDSEIIGDGCTYLQKKQNCIYALLEECGTEEVTLLWRPNKVERRKQAKLDTIV